MRMFAGLRNISSTRLMSATLDQLLHVGCDVAHMRFIKFVPVYRNLQLVEVRLFAQLSERVEVDVAVDDVLHARLCLAYILHRTAETQRPLIASGRPDRHGIADARPGDLNGVAFDQYLAGTWRPGALLRLQRADANIPEILHDKQSQVAPLNRPGFNPAS